MENYKKTLDELYLEARDRECPPNNKYQFLGSNIFDFTTYDSDIDELFARNMVDVIACILDQSQFEYQKEKAKYINYLTMVNMPFLYEKLDWGMSIRGAWFDEGSGGEDDSDYNINFNWTIPKNDIKIFMKQLIEWVNA